MYSTEAIKRINRIEWNMLGKKESNEEDGDLLCEFLRRMAVFSTTQSISAQPPFFINVAKELGDENYKEDLSWCNEDTYKYINSQFYISFVIKSYIQLAYMADRKKEVSKYLEIYDPFIRLLEKGNQLIYKSGYMDITNVCSVPIIGWLERAKLQPIDISQI